MDGFVGVKPLGAQVRLTEGMRRKPDSSTKAMWAWSFWAVFFTLGQSFLTQSAILASSRCDDLRSGFWWLQPIW